MRGFLLLLIVLTTQLQLSLLCPEPCMVCSADAIICSKLSRIIEAPDSTKAVILTDGLIETVDCIVNSSSSNMSILGLSNNIISTITGKAFQNLTVLKTLSLDHNRISSPSLNESVFFWLRSLETLHLGHNSLEELNGFWFQNTESLKTLLLEGNLLTSLDSSTFALSDLKSLETLDLSANLISYVGRGSFRNLPRLRRLDLSQNRLQNMPDAFSYLTRLSTLNLDLNRWRCSCRLRELVYFLNSYIQSPGKVLYNGKKMACANSDNPNVQTVLELTKVNCMPSNKTVRADIVAKSSITSQRYVRDVGIAVVFSCLGGVLITLAILAGVLRKLGKGFGPKQQTKEAEEQSSPTWDYTVGDEAPSMSYACHNLNYQGHPPWDDDMSSDGRPGTTGTHFICRNCRKTLHHETYSRGIQPNVKEEWPTYMGRGQWKDAAVYPSMIRDEDGGTQRCNAKDIHGSNTDYDTSTMGMHQIALRRHISIAQRQTFTPEQPNTQMPVLKHQHGGYGVKPVHQCHQTHVDNTIQSNTSRNQEEGILPRSSKVIVYRDIFNYNQSNMEHQGVNQARVQRTVTFDLAMERAMFVSRREGPYKISKTKMSEVLGQKSKASPCKLSTKGNRKSTHSRQSNIHSPGSQESSSLKVKLNLNPLRRSQVHPKSSSKHEDKEISRTSKKVKDKKPQKRVKKKDKQGQKGEEKPETSQCEESPTNPTETGSSGIQSNPEESCSLMQTSILLAESIKPLDTANCSDPHISTLDLNLALGSPEDVNSQQQGLQKPHEGEELPKTSMTPVSSTVSVVQEYLPPGDGSPKRKLRLIVPEKTSNRPQTSLEKKIR